MAMGKRRCRARQPSIWVASADLPRGGGHPFYERLNRVLDEAGFDAFVERQCATFYADGVGRPSLAPGRYVRMLLLGYVEGLDSERAIAWRVADSLSLRQFLDIALHEASPDHSTVSRTRRRIDLETHQAVFTWVLQRLADAGLVRGKTVGIDATTLEANAALRSIVRRDTGEDYETLLRGLAEASGMSTPTRAELARFDRKRPKKGSNDDWTHPQDPDAKITRMKDGRTRLAHKAEHAVDIETVVAVGVTVPDSHARDTSTTAPDAHLSRTGRLRHVHVNLLQRLLMRRLSGVGTQCRLHGRARALRHPLILSPSRFSCLDPSWIDPAAPRHQFFRSHYYGRALPRPAS